MSDTPIRYLLNNYADRDTLEAEHVPATLPDLVVLERQLIPLLNWVRKVQGKKPVIVPKDRA